VQALTVDALRSHSNRVADCPAFSAVISRASEKAEMPPFSSRFFVLFGHPAFAAEVTLVSEVMKVTDGDTVVIGPMMFLSFDLTDHCGQ
jgi:hypothetical protein